MLLGSDAAEQGTVPLETHNTRLTLITVVLRVTHTSKTLYFPLRVSWTPLLCQHVE